jgi:hypothetical protein
MNLEDGKGTGFRARVDKFNRLDTHNESNQTVLARHEGRAWSFNFEDVDPVGADDKFVYMTYTGSKALIFTTFRLTSTVTGILKVKKVTGTPSYVSETAMGITSRNLGSAVTLSGAYNQDTNITTLVDAGTILNIGILANDFHDVSLESQLIMTPGTAIALEWGTSTGILNGTITGYEVTLSDI